FITAAQRAAAVTALASSGAPFGIVPVDTAAREQLIKSYPYFSHDEINVGTYGASSIVPTVGIGCQWITTKAPAEDVVFRLTDSLWSDRTQKQLLAGFPNAQAIIKNRAAEGTNGVPLHPGALRYYEQEGIAK